MSGEGEDGKLPSVDHGRRTDKGRDKDQDMIFNKNGFPECLF